MARFSPYGIQVQLTRMFDSGQSFFATTKVQDWLREHNQDPQAYEIIFHKKPALPGSEAIFLIEVELRRRDGQPVEAWLLRELNQAG